MSSALARIAEMPKTDLVAGYARLKASVAKHKEKIAQGSERVLDTALTAGGGAAFALVEHYGPSKQFLGDIDNAAVVGVGLSLAGAMGWLGDASEALSQVGNGMLAVEAYKRVGKALDKR